MINRVTLIGHLGGDPEVRRLEGGTAVARFSLATNESYKDKDGNFQTITEWHNVVVWREQAERAERSLKKGMLVYVEGKISYRKYTTQEGQERHVTDIVANTFRMLERREGAQENRFPPAENAPAARNTEMPVTAPPADAVPAGGDDLPF